MFLAWKRRINAPANRGRDTRALQADRLKIFVGVGLIERDMVTCF